MDRQFLHRMRKNSDEGIKPSKSAASHTADNLQPMAPESPANPQNPEIVSGSGKHLHPPKKKKSLKERLKHLTKKQWVIVGIVTALVLAGIGAGLYFLLKDDAEPVKQVQKEEAEPEVQPTTVPSNLTGLPVAPSVNDRPVTAVMIENSTDARPQAGLTVAGVVFEAVAEGGITRFIALYQDGAPDYIGPVRSVRPYYIQWAVGFDAAIAHAGGSAQALNDIKAWGVKDLNHNSNYFFRVNNRAAPHNLYTSMSLLNQYEAQKGYGKAVFTSLVRKPSETPSATPNARAIDFNISSANFNAHFDYDAATNSYKRSVGGKPHMDERSGAQLQPKVVVALVMGQGKSGIYTTYGTIGSGQAFVFQDGIVQQGTWKKDSNTANFVFTDANGAALKLNAGQTWFTALGGADRVSYTP